MLRSENGSHLSVCIDSVNYCKQPFYWHKRHWQSLIWKCWYRIEDIRIESKVSKFCSLSYLRKNSKKRYCRVIIKMQLLIGKQSWSATSWDRKNSLSCIELCCDVFSLLVLVVNVLLLNIFDLHWFNENGKKKLFFRWCLFLGDTVT